MENYKNKTRNISKTILKAMFYGGAIVIASTSPQFGHRIMPKVIKYLAWKRKKKKEDKKRFYNSFYYLKRKGFIKMNYNGKQLHISLTDEGNEFVKRFKIDDLKIKKSKIWDKKWRVLIFDIREKERIKREALRGKLKELGLFKLQNSVWIFPYDLNKEISILRNFFGLGKSEMQVIIASSIEEDKQARIFFKL